MSHINRHYRASLSWSFMESQHFTICQAYKCLSHTMTKPTKWVGILRRLRSAWASSQSDQSSLSAWRKLGSLATHWVHSEDSDQTGRMPKLIYKHSEDSDQTGRMPRLIYEHSEDSDQTGQMPRLSWVFAGRTPILLVLSWGGSFLLHLKQDRDFSNFPCYNPVTHLVLYLSRPGFALPVAIVANAKKKYFWHKKISFGENKWRKKILLPKNRHLNITDLGYFMPLNRQLQAELSQISGWSINPLW